MPFANLEGTNNLAAKREERSRVADIHGASDITQSRCWLFVLC